MFRSSDEILDVRDAIAEQLQKGEITPEGAIERLREREPRSAMAFALEGDLLLRRGEIDRAEEAFLNARSAGPCSVGPLFHLADIYEQKGSDTEALACRLLGLRLIAASDEVPEEVAKNFETLGKSARSPEAFAALAERTEAALGDRPWPETLRPYRLLVEVQRQSQQGLDPDVLREILDQYDACEPVFGAALRQWANEDDAPMSDETASILLAILGERGAVELIDDIFPDDQYPTSSVLRHSQWAVWRLAQRFPQQAFSRFQSIAATADATGRCFLAEHFYMLPPEIAGRKEAILALMDRFPEADDPDGSGRLLLTVWRLMDMLGSPVDSKMVLEKHRRKLDEETRRFVNEFIDSTDHPFVPCLAALVFDEIGVEEIVSDLALMDSSEDDLHDHGDEEWGDDEDFEDEREPRPGRNDPCWCGSGKKYKKCCLELDEAEQRAVASPASAEFAKVFGDIIETVVNRMNRSDFITAHRMFFDREPGMVEPDDDASAAFSQWLVLDYRMPSSGRTVIEEYLRKRGGRLPERERALVDAFRRARYALWEVVDVKKRKGIKLKDYFGDEQLDVDDPVGSIRGVTGNLLVAYLFEREGRWEFFDTAEPLPMAVLPMFKQMIDVGSRKANITPSAYFRSRSHEWRREIARLGREAMKALGGAKIVNAEGDELLFAAAIYDVTDPGAAEKSLAAAGMFAPNGPGELAWLDSATAKMGSVFGAVHISGGQLRLECNSRKRLSIGRQLVEKHAGELLHHVRDEFKSPHEAMLERADSGPGVQ